MKKLIDVVAVENLKAEGKNIVYVDGNTLLTPAARDAIINNDMVIKEESAISATLIFNVLSKLQESGLLNGILEACGMNKNYESQCDIAGFKLVKGNSIKTEVLETGDPKQYGKVNYREIIGSDDSSSMAAGIISIDDVDFNWKTECQEIYYIISGCITVTIAGKVYEAKPGDVFFIKKDVECAFGAKGLGKAFYVTY